MDSGYRGAVHHPRGLSLHTNARLAQIVCHQMSESVEESYSGIYQDSKSL